MSSEDKKDIVVVKPIGDLIEKGIENNSDLDKLEKLLNLKMKYEANEAKKFFNNAMVDVQRNIPTIAKSLKNTHTNSKYASLDSIISKTKKIYTDEGFSISFYEGDTAKEDHVRICADVVHRAGHKETYHFDIPLDGKGVQGRANMTAIHAKASSTSYAHRYLMCMIWNIPTGDDDDAQGASVGYITEAQANTLKSKLNEKNISHTKFLTYMKADSFDKIPQDRLKIAETSIKNTKKRV